MPWPQTRCLQDTAKHTLPVTRACKGTRTTHARSLARSHARTKARNALLSGSLGLGMSALTLEKVRGLSTVPTMGGAVGHTVFTESARFTFWGGGQETCRQWGFSAVPLRPCIARAARGNCDCCGMPCHRVR